MVLEEAAEAALPSAFSLWAVGRMVMAPVPGAASFTLPLGSNLPHGLKGGPHRQPLSAFAEVSAPPSGSRSAPLGPVVARTCLCNAGVCHRLPLCSVAVYLFVGASARLKFLKRKVLEQTWTKKSIQILAKTGRLY